MDPEERHKITMKHWKRVRQYVDALKVQTQFKRKQEANYKKNLDDNDDYEEDTQSNENTTFTSWILINTDGPFYKSWSFLVTILTIYTLIVTPFLMVHP